MNIGVIGLGYVGAVTAACFAEAGHRVFGVDVSDIKVDELNNGQSPLSEFGLQDLISKHVASGALSATTRLEEVFDDAELFIVSVGTPSLPSGDVDLSYVDSVVDELGDLLARAQSRKTVVITSTIPPGTINDRIRPRLEKRSGLQSRESFGLAFSPEFLREGTAIADFSKPEKVVLGCDDEPSRAALHALFGPFDGPIIDTTVEVAEMVKFSANAWHALKVTFANEIGRLCAAFDVDSHEVMRIFKRDTRLNISEAYLTPGFAFGGSCLPKDLRTLTYRARAAGVTVPMLDAVLPSNREHLRYSTEAVERQGDGKVLLLGLAFKSGTDDLRESPTVPLAEALLGKGRDVRVFDEYVQLDRLVGSNLLYVTRQLPHLASLLGTDLDAELAKADIIVLSQTNPRFAAALGKLKAHQRVVDLAGVGRQVPTKAEYFGATW
jgi:GDP-mannose 6-dehydrogenase